MPNANEDGAGPPELPSTVLRAALAALPIAIEVFARGGERVFANPAAAGRAANAGRRRRRTRGGGRSTAAPC